MPKERRDRSVSFDRSRASPFACSSGRRRHSLPKTPPEGEENVKEWEEARCPVCMEHPHNALLLVCSSHEKGCRPYMCDTSYRHSNCFDQFRKSSVEISSATPQQEGTPHTVEHSSDGFVSEAAVTNVQVERTEEDFTSMHPMSCDDLVKTKLVCPLCRGNVTGWTVVESARHFMNAKSRSCACETCDFSGPYKDLRKHARLEHPSVRPSVADPERQRSWRRMERQRDLGDLISTLQNSIGEDRSEDSPLSSFDEGGWLTVFFLIRVFRPENSSTSSWSGASRTRAPGSGRRRSTRLWGETHDMDSGFVSRDDDNESSDGGSSSRRQRDRIRAIRRRPTPDNEL